MPDDNALIVRVEELGKAFRRYTQKPFLARNLVLGLVGKAVKAEPRWILRGVNLEVRRGEAIALLGKNGSGKSTLLRLISGTLAPSSGKISVRGRVTPLLGVGGGMHADMTGREYLQTSGTLLGLASSSQPISVEAIAEFAGIGDFLDTPLRYYSSGMTARLGVSLAIHGTPDLLLVDESLSVGDKAFRDRCADRVHEAREQGCALILASHDGELVRRLCTRALWLHDGHIHKAGEAAPILEEYEAMKPA